MEKLKIKYFLFLLNNIIAIIIELYNGFDIVFYHIPILFLMSLILFYNPKTEINQRRKYLFFLILNSLSSLSFLILEKSNPNGNKHLNVALSNIFIFSSLYIIIF